MNETYMITAKTVEEAIAIANREYADENHEVSYEIVDMPKKGFLGIGAKDAKIKVTVSKSVSSELDSLVADLRGMKVITAKGDDGENRRDKNQKNGNKNKNNNKNQNQQKNQSRDGDKQKNQQNQQNGQKGKDQNRDKKQADKQQNEKAAPAAEKQETPLASQKQESRSSLKNQGKPNRRQPQKHSSGEQSIESSSYSVSTPMGLSDFVAEDKKDSFGSVKQENGKSGGRMNNDIRRNKNKGGRKDSGERVIYENRNEMITRYDVAESDEDYKKLDNLEDRELTIDEIRSSVMTSTVRGDSGISADVLDAAIEAAIDIAPKAEKIKREAVSRAEMDFALEFANTLLANMGMGAQAVEAECPEDEEFIVTEECTVYPKINIVGDDTGILIGHHGETLDAIQYLVNLSALRRSKQKDGDYVKIVVDIENYRQKREETLRTLARRMAARAVKYKKNVFLEPMNAYERRIIHSELQDVPNVSTHSVGADRDRKIIITYEGPDKVVDNRRRGKKGNGQSTQQKNAVKEKTEENASSEEKKQSKNRRRPRKVQKMPIEKIGDILVDGASAPSDSETAPSEE